eukprot:TRINITY_DN4807_c0_g1_i1.p1 TRINITY_DN4807_c0_g1~~TRINITY_DN4807_c0_g1_i1.p1  ORF type:complete len:796 (+),score=85.16 TRINITY_DN4807_c0_g1_i1:59-2446(+)
MPHDPEAETYVTIEGGGGEERELLNIVKPPLKGAEEETANNEEKTVKAVALKRYVLREFEKTVVCARLPLILLWLAALTAVSVMSGAASARSYNMLFHLEQAHHDELSIEKFQSIKTHAELWEWVHSTVNHLWLRDVAPQNYPLGYFLIRQYRVEPEEYSIPSTISPNFIPRLPKNVSRDWGDGETADGPYGPGGIYNPNSRMQNPISVLTVNTQYNTYSNPEDAYTVPLDLLRSLPDVTREVELLQNTSWLSNTTRIVCFDIMTYNPAVGSFAGNHMFIEFFASGNSAAASKAYPFKILHLDSNFNRFVLAVDCGVIIGTIILLFSMGGTVYMNWVLGEQWISAWEIYDSMMIGFLVTAYAYRMQMWGMGPALVHGRTVTSSTDPDLEMFTELFQYGYMYERSNTYLAVSVTMGWLRFLRVLQHTSRLGVLSSTIKHSAGELFSLLVIYIVVLTGYSLGATMLFGPDFNEMSSVGNSFGYLIRLTISAEINTDWARLAEIHPEWVWLFMGTFMVLCWLILLNMVLAIVSGSFAAVQHAMGGKVASWSYKSIMTDLKQLKSHFTLSRGPAVKMQSKRKKVVRILNDHIQAHPMGDKATLTYTEWHGLVKGNFSRQVSTHVFYQSVEELDPVVVASGRGVGGCDEVLARVDVIEGELKDLKELLMAGGVGVPLCDVCGCRKGLPYCGVTGKPHDESPHSEPTYSPAPTVATTTPSTPLLADLVPPIQTTSSPLLPVKKPTHGGFWSRAGDRRPLVRVNSTGRRRQPSTDSLNGSDTFRRLSAEEPPSPTVYVRTVA